MKPASEEGFLYQRKGFLVFFKNLKPLFLLYIYPFAFGKKIKLEERGLSNGDHSKIDENFLSGSQWPACYWFMERSRWHTGCAPSHPLKPIYLFIFNELAGSIFPPQTIFFCL